MKDKLILEDGDTLQEIRHKSEGSMGQTDIYTYNILDINGEVKGTVKHVDHTSIGRGFKRTQNLEQRDLSGNIVLDIHW